MTSSDRIYSKSRWTLLRTIAVSMCSLVMASAAQAQTSGSYPDRPVRMLVNFPAGGITDLTFRKISERFQALTGQRMIIENRPGRGVASAALANAAPDGYTLGLVGRGHMALQHILQGKLPYHPVTDFTWIAGLTSSWFGLFVPADSPYKSLADIVAAAKAKPGDLTYATSFGHGGVSHVPMEEFERKADIQMRHIPFRGDSDAIVQLIRGEVDMMVAAGTAMPFVEEGKVRLIAWLTPERHQRLNEIPTFRELGYPVEVLAPIALGGPKNMPPERVAYLEDTMQRVLKDPELVEFMDENYQRNEFRTSAELTAWAPKQYEIEADIVKRYNLAAP